jgi:hypothetical protein
MISACCEFVLGVFFCAGMSAEMKAIAGTILCVFFWVYALLFFPLFLLWFLGLFFSPSIASVLLCLL